jgi:hypothetical protein
VKCLFKIFLGITPPESHIGRKCICLGSFKISSFFCEGQSKWPIAKKKLKKKLNFGMHSQLIYMGLEEGMITKDI